ncbi:MAG TPA: EAL domain-containing protein [Pseudolabrys sp.]|nr:EAL domain-containing protein [Pseudolabrys sp.]
MDRSLQAFVVRHRVTIKDVAVVIGVVLLVGFGVYQYFAAGSATADRHIDIQEVLVLGGLVVIPIVYLGWRRVKDLEREISRRIAAERRAHEAMHTDPLTGLANRRQFEAMLHGAVAIPCAPEEAHAVLMLDIKSFGKINELYGHAEGDDVLVAVAERLRGITRESDFIARTGADEFALIAYHLAGVEGATSVAARIMRAMETPIHIGSRKHRVDIAIGIAVVPRDGVMADEVMRKADVALGRAMNEPQSASRFFEDGLDRHMRERDTIARELAFAIGSSDALRPWYQPIVDLATGRIVALEALARWQHPALGEIAPDRFIPIAEAFGLIRGLGDWLMRCALEEARNWPHDVTLAFNISPAQLHDRTLGLRILSMLGEFGLSPRRLAIELTESAFVRDIEGAREILSSLREAGVQVAADDFGTGYSSLYHLRQFKLDIVKIDRGFVHAMETEPESLAIVKAIVGLGKGLGLTTVAEGIETARQRDILLAEGCQSGQGFLFSAAVPAEKTAAFFTAGWGGGRPAAIRT